MLTERRSTLLNLIVREYVDTALPVGSQYVVRRHAIPYSAATVRIEMARLEDDGYISQPHTSAGRIPSDKGYRYYVETLMEEERLAREEQETIRHQFHQAERALEEWFILTASLLARAVGNFAVVTAPRSKETRLRHVQLVSLHDYSALCVAVLQEARVRQQVVALKEALDQDALDAAASRLNARLAGLDNLEIRNLAAPAAEIDEAFTIAVVELMEQESVALGEIFRDGVKEVLSQPEFSRSDRMLDLVDVLEERSLASLIPSPSVSDDTITVLIGSENQNEAMQECSLVIARYGADGPSGVVAVLGPTRMRYERTIPTVRFMAAMLGELMSRI